MAEQSKQREQLEAVVKVLATDPNISEDAARRVLQALIDKAGGPNPAMEFLATTAAALRG